MGVVPPPWPKHSSVPSSSLSSSSVVLHGVIMIRPLVAMGALVVLAVVAEAASTKYEDDYKGDSYGKSTSSYGEDSYKHEPEYQEVDYHEPTYEKYDDEYGYGAHKYDHKPMYKHKTMKSRYGHGGDSYGVDSYGKSYSSYKPSLVRHKRAAGKHMQAIREEQRSREALCLTETEERCIFPFRVGSHVFYGCTTKFPEETRVNDPWCATDVDSSRKVTSWEYCSTGSDCAHVIH